jgi:hypothetical protein
MGIRAKLPLCSICGAKGATMGNAWTWRYQSISLDHHRPKRRILSGSTDDVIPIKLNLKVKMILDAEKILLV